MCHSLQKLATTSSEALPPHFKHLPVDGAGVTLYFAPEKSTFDDVIAHSSQETLQGSTLCNIYVRLHCQFVGMQRNSHLTLRAARTVLCSLPGATGSVTVGNSELLTPNYFGTAH
jgi:hypothetical protein